MQHDMFKPETPEQAESRRKSEYVRRGGNHCPFCESQAHTIKVMARLDADALLYPIVATDERLSKVTCLNPACGKVWYDWFILYGVMTEEEYDKKRAAAMEAVTEET
jgi:hypothetical protein